MSVRALFVVLFAGFVACSTPDPGARVVATVPDRATFPQVSDVLAHGCGTLDCHGSSARNLRLFGHEGMRLAATDRPSSHPNTTQAEYDENFTSIVGLEPEILSAVVASAGAAPERLTLVRKARGDEHHKAGAIVERGDDRDVCLTSWLAGHTDTSACTRAASAF